MNRREFVRSAISAAVLAAARDTAKPHDTAAPWYRPNPVGRDQYHRARSRPLRHPLVARVLETHGGTRRSYKRWGYRRVLSEQNSAPPPCGVLGSVIFTANSTSKTKRSTKKPTQPRSIEENRILSGAPAATPNSFFCQLNRLKIIAFRAGFNRAF